MRRVAQITGTWLADVRGNLAGMLLGPACSSACQLTLPASAVTDGATFNLTLAVASGSSNASQQVRADAPPHEITAGCVRSG